MRKKSESLIGKSKEILKNGTDPIEEGMKNFRRIDPEIESLAQERSEICASCDLLEEEPIKSFQVVDTRIPLFSKKMCGDCFCVMPYKSRQTQTICHKWNR